MRQKLFTLLFTIAASIGTMLASDTEVDGIWYDFDDSNNTASVAYRGSSWDSYSNEYSGAVAISSSVTYNAKTYSVTSIGGNAFVECTGLTSITIPNSVTSIGDNAFFRCSGLISIILPNSVTSIGDRLFYGCTSLTSPVYNAHIFAYLPTSYSGAYTIPSGVESIAGHAFCNCIGLTSVTIPNSVTSIGNEAFSGCTGLPVEDNLRYADAYLVGAVNKTLSTYTIKEGIKWIGSSAFQSCKNLTSVTIPNSVTSIGGAAFASCTNLTSITIPNSVTSIGGGAFASCTNLTSFIIPKSIDNIGINPLGGCSNLISIDVDSENPYYCALDGVLFNKAKTTLIQYPGGKQGGYVIPNSVTSMGDGAFSGCTGLTSITIPNSITHIGVSVFNECRNLTSVTIPNSVITIGQAAFASCTNLTSITIPNSVTSIGVAAFSHCTALTSVTCQATTPPAIGEEGFYKVDCSQIPLYVPIGSISAYQSADKWKDFTNILPIAAEGAETNTIKAEPTPNSVEVTWPVVVGAYTYELVIRDKDGNIICTLTFNSSGQLISIAFAAPSRGGAPQQKQETGFAFTITGLTEGTSYDVTITAKDSGGNTLDTKTVPFTTKGDAPTGIDDINAATKSQKIVRDGQVLILRGEKTYTVTGQEVK